MNRRPLVAATAAAGAVVMVASAGSAGAATTAQPAAGRAVSSMSLLQLTAAGHTLRLVDLELLSSTLGSQLSTINVVPVTVDGTQLGKQVITPADGAKTVGSVSSPGAVAPVASVTSPALEAVATNEPSAHAGTTSLGSVKLFGLPIDVMGAIASDSGVTSESGAAGQKVITIEDVALPSIADLLAKLGLDLGALPVGTLTNLVDQLHLVTGAVSTAQSAVDAAQAQVDTAVSDLATQTSALTAAQGALTTATTAFDAAEAALEAKLAEVLPTGMSLVDYLALDDAGKAVIDETVTGLTAAFDDYASAEAAQTAAQTAVTAAQAAVNTAQALVTSLTTALDSAVASLVAAIEGVLDGTPLVSLARLEVATVAAATSASAGGQVAKVVGGEVSGLKVLGTDVLKTVLGSSTVEVSDLLGGALTEVNTAIETLNGTLSSVLSNVPSLPALEVPAPEIGLLTKSTSTSVADGFGKASATVSALSISIPGLTVPAAVQVPDAVSLPGVSAAGAGDVVSSAVSLKLLSMSEQAAFRPAVGSGTNGPKGELPHTGLPAAPALASLVLLGVAVALRRRFLAEV